MHHRFITPLVALTALVGGFAATTVEAVGGTASDCQQRRSPGNLTVVGLTSDQQVVCFREDRPRLIRSSAPVTGLAGDTGLVGIDHRPATGALYAIGDLGGVYIVDSPTGQVTKVAQMDVALSGGAFDVDFNPTVDRLRVVSDNGQNLRINVDTGATTVDGGLNNGTGAAVLGVTGAAYTNNDGDPSTATTLFGIDTTADRVVIQAPPNAGTLNPTGNLGPDASGDGGFDIYSAVRGGATVNVRALAALDVDGSSTLYGVDLLTGRVTALGAMGAPIVDIAFPI